MGIKSYATIQEHNATGRAKHRVSNGSMSRGESALGVIGESLALLRITFGRMEIASKKVNFYKEVVEKALDDQRERIAEKGMGITVHIPDELEVTCDPKCIQIVYNNLVSSAIEYGNADTEIYIGYFGLLDKHHYFNVAYSGEWIRENDRERIFGKHMSLGNKGAGLELYIAMKIIKKHGGDIWVEPCYFVEGKYILARSMIREASDRLMTGNNFVFTIPE